MTEDSIAARAVINAPAETVFDLLADPSNHMAIDGTGWVRDPVDDDRLSETGQIFRMRMHHENHPNKHYEMANRVEVFDRPCAIGWLPGTEPRHIPGRQGCDDDTIEWGGWIWRYDLEPVDADHTEVTLTYDWSRVLPAYRDIEFPPFEGRHLDNSLRHLARLAEQGSGAWNAVCRRATRPASTRTRRRDSAIGTRKTRPGPQSGIAPALDGLSQSLSRRQVWQQFQRAVEPCSRQRSR